MIYVRHNQKAETRDGAIYGELWLFWSNAVTRPPTRLQTGRPHYNIIWTLTLSIQDAKSGRGDKVQGPTASRLNNVSHLYLGSLFPYRLKFYVAQSSFMDSIALTSILFVQIHVSFNSFIPFWKPSGKKKFEFIRMAKWERTKQIFEKPALARYCRVWNKVGK